MYRGIIRLLLYLTPNRPYTMFIFVQHFSLLLRIHTSMLLRKILKSCQRDWISTFGIQNELTLSLHSMSMLIISYKVSRKRTLRCFPQSISYLMYSKKHNSVALPTIEVRYIVVVAYCTQFLWMTWQLRDLGVNYREASLRCDIMNAIDINKNLVQHLRMKHIEVRYHYIKDYVEKRDISIEFMPT